MRKKIFRFLYFGGFIISGIPLLIAMMIWGQEASGMAKNIMLVIFCLGIIVTIASMFIALNWGLQTLKLCIQKKLPPPGAEPPVSAGVTAPLKPAPPANSAHAQPPKEDESPHNTQGEQKP